MQAYLEAHPTFYGTAALLDQAGVVTASPYVYRTSDGYRTHDLARPDYNVEDQGWLMMPLASCMGLLTPPYFDACGGEVCMVTRSVSARDSEGIFAIVTTDLSTVVAE